MFGAFIYAIGADEQGPQVVAEIGKRTLPETRGQYSRARTLGKTVTVCCTRTDPYGADRGSGDYLANGRKRCRNLCAFSADDSMMFLSKLAR